MAPAIKVVVTNIGTASGLTFTDGQNLYTLNPQQNATIACDNAVYDVHLQSNPTVSLAKLNYSNAQTLQVTKGSSETGADFTVLVTVPGA
ncbi:hypothetical protein AMATHDRAFT_4382 [Amanita thiersii Skay4041]|uniref:Uncharacterized protein n=1 Tax=Amanita thiersii Skay4041 TaxID=703135 RepID=A0A2A9NKX4_9AGAR|nr:hypothetical protein AMATHDRAFT_4382 [Amanita thiersii Skay4041]